jgi:polyhydroxyalkanoate synthase
MLEGPIEALSAIEDATGEKKVNAVGYCLGGTLLAATLSYLASKRRRPIESATCFTTMIDFSDPGELEVFIDEDQISLLEEKMSKTGYLEGSQMANTFSMLRANDLIWSFFVNNNLLGKDPFPFDLLYWNSDSTRMPAEMHSYYLRNMYQHNRLVEPGGISLDGADVDLGKVKVPMYFLSAIEDHIAPWKSTYAGTRYFGGEVQFVLGGSGHIAGVINPPAKQKYCYWTSRELADTPDRWFEGATRNEGSWWVHWDKWVQSYAGKKVPARTPGDGKLEPLEDAPGSYVSVHLSH